MVTRGEGAVTSDTRKADTFSRVESGAGIHLSVGIGAASALEVRAQQNILPLITTEVWTEPCRSAVPRATRAENVEVILATPQLEGIVLSGGSRGTSRAFRPTRSMSS